MLIVVARALILYILIVVIMRMMGKRQVGQLQPSELVVAILIADLAAVPMQDKDIPLLNGVVPILVLMAAEVVASFLTVRSEVARSVISGRPSIIISGGKIVWNELQEARISLDDLLEQLRMKGYPDISDVEFAVLETSGEVSVIPKSQRRPVCPADLGIDTSYEGLPVTLVVDGKVRKNNLRLVNLTEEWLRSELAAKGVTDINRVGLASLNTEGQLFYQLMGDE
ncbi:MAG: DUF421 domain-containing protein [Bacillota bacterium]|jgi:uncharacterized membrane protein YcaP (DUF421 family)|nr:DUF421 domain-containing protein [Bacillota bacterium]HOB90987.1 DUF421 domain-containing protein [Bacillota bacterium]HPZ54113.1 DUF421 domain-containing protein [Bacillota bacterium]HQD18500.1 DUF421 domain-containing protein [Bacillota bacterium]